MLNTTNRASRFLFEDNCNASKNPSSVICVPFPKRHLTNLFKRIHSYYVFLEDRQKLIKRISLNTWTLIMVFNEDSNISRFFFENNCNSSKNPSSEIRNYVPKLLYLKFLILFLYIFHILENKENNNNITQHDGMNA